MANSTSAQRLLYGDARCENGYDLLEAHRALDAWFEAFDYAVGPGSGAVNCRPITGGIGYSLHAYAWQAPFTWWNGRTFKVGLADDINPAKNPYGPRLVTDMPRAMVDGITAVRTKNGKQAWVWGGYFTPNHDAMHYQIGCGPVDLASGIDPATLPPTTPPPEDDVPRYELFVPDAGDDKGKVFLVGPATREYIDAVPSVELAELEKQWGVHKTINLVAWARIVRDTVLVKPL